MISSSAFTRGGGGDVDDDDWKPMFEYDQTMMMQARPRSPRKRTRTERYSGLFERGEWKGQKYVILRDKEEDEEEEILYVPDEGPSIAPVVSRRPPGHKRRKSEFDVRFPLFSRMDPDVVARATTLSVAAKCMLRIANAIQINYRAWSVIAVNSKPAHQRIERMVKTYTKFKIMRARIMCTLTGKQVSTNATLSPFGTGIKYTTAESIPLRTSQGVLMVKSLIREVVEDCGAPAKFSGNVLRTRRCRGVEYPSNWKQIRNRALKAYSKLYNRIM